MNPFRKSKPPPPDSPDKDRLTVSLWPFRIDATGAGVKRAYVLAFALCVLWFATLIVYVVKPFPIPSPVAEVSKLVPKGGG